MKAYGGLSDLGKINVATYPDDGLLFRASEMVLCAHADTGFNNKTRSRSRGGAHIFLSEDDARPRWNGAVLAIDLETTSVVILGFPTMLIMWKSVQDDGTGNWVETASIKSS